jgi:hypothetical protein
MCAPAVAAIDAGAIAGAAALGAVSGAAGIAGAAVAHAIVNAVKDQDFNACPDSVLDFTAAVTYTPPTRLAGPVSAPVASSATVDQLVAARRTSTPLA